MRSDDRNSKKKSINDELGSLLPTSILTDVLNDSELNSSRIYSKNYPGQECNDNSARREAVNYLNFTQERRFTNSQRGQNNYNEPILFNPKGRYYSHSGIANFNHPQSNCIGSLSNYNNFNIYNQVVNNSGVNMNNGGNFVNNKPNWVQHNQNSQNYQNYTNFQKFNPVYGNLNQNNIQQQSGACFIPNLIKSHNTKNFDNLNKNLHNASNNSNGQYFSNDPSNLKKKSLKFDNYFDYNSNNSNNSNTNSHDNSNIIQIENSFDGLSLEKPKKKTFSSGNLSQFSKNNQQQNKSNNNNKQNKRHSLFINKDCNKKREEEEDNLQNFVENLDIDLHKYIRSQRGSRVMQKFLNKITPEDLDYFINALGYNLPLLMTDVYGNYFCQKLFQSCSAEQRISILNYIAPEIVNISYDNSGTHALQSLLEIVNLYEEEEIVLRAIKKFALDMAYDNNATHVIQKIIVCIGEEKRDFLNIIVLENLKNLSLDCNGICVVKKLVNTNKSEEFKSKIIDEIYINCLEIVQSPFGNYAVQHLIEEWGVQACKKIINVIQQNIISLSMQKYSSNVVERCLELADKETQKCIINEIMNPCKLLGLLKNKYGSFVLQKSISYLDKSEKTDLKNFLQNKINVTSSKEKARVSNFFELL